MELRKLSKEEIILIGFFPLMIYWLLKGYWAQSLYLKSVSVYWIADIFQYIVTPLAGVYLLSKYCGFKPREYGFRRFSQNDSIGYLIVLFGFVFATCWIALIPAREIAYRFLWQLAGNWEHADTVPKEQPFRVIVSVYLAISAAFVEETVFRSLPWLYFKRRFPTQMRTGLYVAITAVLFASIHWWQGPHMVIAALGFGVVAAALYSKIQNIWPFVFSHFLIDLGAFG